MKIQQQWSGKKVKKKKKNAYKAWFSSFVSEEYDDLPRRVQPCFGPTKLCARGKEYRNRSSKISLLLWPSCFKANLKFLMSWRRRQSISYKILSGNKELHMQIMKDWANGLQPTLMFVGVTIYSQLGSKMVLIVMSFYFRFMLRGVYL